MSPQVPADGACDSCELATASGGAVAASAQAVVPPARGVVCCLPQVLFAKPEDPLAHLSALTAAKLKARNGAPFDPTEPDRLLAGVYSLPPDVGSAVGSDPEPAPPSTSVAAVAPASAASFAERVLEASRAISSELDPVKAADSIVKHACQGEKGGPRARPSRALWLSSERHQAFAQRAGGVGLSCPSLGDALARACTPGCQCAAEPEVPRCCASDAQRCTASGPPCGPWTSPAPEPCLPW